MAEVILACVLRFHAILSYLTFMLKVTNFFTGAPNVLRWPDCFSLHVSEPEKFTRIELGKIKADWICKSSVLEVAIQKEYPDLIKRFVKTLSIAE